MTINNQKEYEVSVEALKDLKSAMTALQAKLKNNSALFDIISVTYKKDISILEKDLQRYRKRYRYRKRFS